NNLDIIYDKPLFRQKLADYLIFYNTQRPHKSLQLKSPVGYLIEKGGMSQKSLTYTPPVLRQNKVLPKSSLLRHNPGYQVDHIGYLSARA
ncbi:MAG: hypothetical protein K6T73_11185, partial [Candidatus Bathyarchaeota archaeon]|nr:hypothetical protein [Candidatus Bathyarchaeota archaeon]